MSEHALIQFPPPLEEDAGHHPAPLAADVTCEGDLQSGHELSKQEQLQQSPATAPLAAKVITTEGDLQSGLATPLSNPSLEVTWDYLEAFLAVNSDVVPADITNAQAGAGGDNGVEDLIDDHLGPAGDFGL